MTTFDVGAPDMNAVGGVLSEPPPVELPAPTFGSWDEAASYARAAMLRIKWLEQHVGVNQAAVGVAQIALASTVEEMRLLQIAATELLTQGKNLA